MNNNNWKNIHPDFDKFRLKGELFKWKWAIDCKFDYQQTLTWIRADLRTWEYNITWYLSKKDINPKKLSRDDIEELKKNEKMNWKEVFFTKKLNNE